MTSVKSAWASYFILSLFLLCMLSYWLVTSRTPPSAKKIDINSKKIDITSTEYLASTSPPQVGQTVKVLTDTTAFNLVNVKHRIWTKTDMVKCILGKENAMQFEAKSDTKRLKQLRPKEMEYLIKGDMPCSSRKVSVIVCVYSTPGKVKERAMIRQTWGQQWNIANQFVQTVFLLGRVGDTDIQLKIESESETYKDIVQADFIDSYKNLSLKGLTLLQWTSAYCSSAKYVLKVDEDLCVDIFRIIRIIQLLNTEPRFIFGYVLSGLSVVRGIEQKWGVDKDLMPGYAHYPVYISGWAYVFTSSILPEMNQAAMSVPVFPIDDVYMTAVLAGQVQGLKYFSVYAKDTNGIRQDIDRLARECDTDSKWKNWCESLSSLHKKYKTWIGVDRYHEEMLKCKVSSSP